MKSRSKIEGNCMRKLLSESWHFLEQGTEGKRPYASVPGLALPVPWCGRSYLGNGRVPPYTGLNGSLSWLTRGYM